MKLEDIGFYTLSNERAKNVSWNSELQRCELILTNRCNFKCAYCRGIKKELQGDLSFQDAKNIIDLWGSQNLKNVRFSGGEPTIWKDLIDLVKYTKTKKSINHIAISTNGSANLDYYLDLINAGINDFSISLDACCSLDADKMAGVIAHFKHISNVIKTLSKITYVTAGIVLDERNQNKSINIIKYATSLGVSDIRIIPSAQFNKIESLGIKTKYPILKYRLNNLKNNISIRGLSDKDCHKCHLVKDDMVILNNYHFPCVIYMREQGEPCGNVYGKSMKEIQEERKLWFEKTNCLEDQICKKNCLDVCRQYNNEVKKYSV